MYYVAGFWCDCLVTIAFSGGSAFLLSTSYLCHRQLTLLLYPRTLHPHTPSPYHHFPECRNRNELWELLPMEKGDTIQTSYYRPSFKHSKSFLEENSSVVSWKDEIMKNVYRTQMKLSNRRSTKMLFSSPECAVSLA